jgi:hypothetical protein
MKNQIIFFTVFLLFTGLSCAQVLQSPSWTRSLNTLPDPAQLAPVKTLVDAGGNVLVLSTYFNHSGGSTINKIYLNKFDLNGNPLWNLVYDNNGFGQPRAFDFALDNSDNIYIAAALMDVPHYRPLLIKVSSMGLIQWQRDSTTSFNTGISQQIIFNDDLLYLRDESGIAVFNLNGTEQWSFPVPSAIIAVDHSGRMLASAFDSIQQKLFCYQSNGILDTSFAIINAERIAVDNQNNIYLLAQWPGYEVAKYDSNYAFQWSKNTFPPNLSFGDIGFELLTDYNNDVILVGIVDTMYKFKPDGTSVWKKTMNGLDSYLTDAKIVYTNFLAIAGTVTNSQGYDVKVALFDLNGHVSWHGMYNSNIQQEFSVSLAINNTGIYLLEDSIGNSTIIKFDSPLFTMPVDYSLVCVDSVWYEPGNPSLINVRVFNGNISHLNYPSVRIIAAPGDTIGNPSNIVNFFAHLGNDFQVYQETVTLAGITDFRLYEFLISEGFGDTTAVIGWCTTTDIEKYNRETLVLYPNPVINKLHLSSIRNSGTLELEVYSEAGKLCMFKSISSSEWNSLDVSRLPEGFYILRVKMENDFQNFRFIKMDEN